MFKCEHAVFLFSAPYQRHDTSKNLKVISYRMVFSSVCYKWADRSENVILVMIIQYKKFMHAQQLFMYSCMNVPFFFQIVFTFPQWKRFTKCMTITGKCVWQRLISLRWETTFFFSVVMTLNTQQEYDIILNSSYIDRDVHMRFHFRRGSEFC